MITQQYLSTSIRTPKSLATLAGKERRGKALSRLFYRKARIRSHDFPRLIFFRWRSRSSALVNYLFIIIAGPSLTSSFNFRESETHNVKRKGKFPSRVPTSQKETNEVSYFSSSNRLLNVLIFLLIRFRVFAYAPITQHLLMKLYLFLYPVTRRPTNKQTWIGTSSASGVFGIRSNQGH